MKTQIQRLFCTACGTVAADYTHVCPTTPVSRIQDSPDFSWSAWRAGGIGSSDAPLVMGDAPEDWGSIHTVWEQKTGRLFPKPPTVPMLQGIAAEPFIRAWYERKIGTSMPKDLGMHPDHSFIRASFDGLNRTERKAAEFKFAGKAAHAIAAGGSIPRTYRYQLVQQLLLTDYEYIDYVSYFSPNRKTPAIGHGIIIPFYRDKKFEKLAKKLIETETMLWDCVLKDVPPKKAPAQLFKVRRTK